MRAFWDEKFASEAWLYGTEPNAFIKAHADRIAPKSRVLCLAEGEGRNAAFLAAFGHSVLAVDFSARALEKAKALAADRGVAIETEQADLTAWQCGESFEAITATYLHLPTDQAHGVFEKLLLRLKPGGVFMGEFFAKAQLDYSSGGPKDPALLYEAALFEALSEHPDLHLSYLEEAIVHLDEGPGHRGEGAVVRVVIQRH
jgi:SAM-dependent methyltransferase